MTVKELSMLIGQLKEENKTNTPEERDFNLKWIEFIKLSIKKSLEKAGE